MTEWSENELKTSPKRGLRIIGAQLIVALGLEGFRYFLTFGWDPVDQCVMEAPTIWAILSFSLSTIYALVSLPALVKAQKGAGMLLDSFLFSQAQIPLSVRARLRYTFHLTRIFYKVTIVQLCLQLLATVVLGASLFFTKENPEAMAQSFDKDTLEEEMAANLTQRIAVYTFIILPLQAR